MLAHGADAMPLQPIERPLVHVVDDDAWVRDALVIMLDSIKLETRTYATARDFLVSKLQDRPGCVVLDIRLPDMNGLDFQARLTELGCAAPSRDNDWAWEHPDDRSGNEARSGGFSSETLRRSGDD